MNTPAVLPICSESSDGRLAVIYTFNTDIGDGMESEGVHKEDSPETRELAMQMGINIAIYAMSN